MADITEELQTIATAVYGSEMRSAIHDAIEKVNDGSETMIESAGNISNSYVSGTYVMQKTGNIVTFQFTCTINTTFVHDQDVIFEIPSGFAPANEETNRIFPIFPSPYDSNGMTHYPFVSLEKSDGAYKFIANYMTGSVVGYLNAFSVSGTYSIAPLATT